MSNVVFKKIVEHAEIPKYAHTDDSGFDFIAIEDIHIEHGKVTLARTGLAVAMSSVKTNKNLGYTVEIELQIRPKSGLAVREGITLINSPCTIDFGYRGELLVPMTRMIPGSYVITAGSKFCQGVLCPIFKGASLLASLESLPDTDRGTGGFGSTGL